jgi:hypothetical protein
MLTPEQAESMLPYMQAIAEGKTIQVKWFNEEFYDYTEYLPGYPDKNAEWRIKPEPKTIKYRVALIAGTNANATPHTVVINNQVSAPHLEHAYGFKKWITDWVEVEVDL